MQVTEHMMLHLTRTHRSRESSGANVCCPPSRIEHTPGRSMRNQNIDFIRHGLVQHGESLLVRHEVPLHEGWSPGRTEEAYAVQDERLIEQNMNTRTEQSESRLQVNFEALIVIAGNDDRVLRPIGRIHPFAQFGRKDGCLL